MVRTYRIEEFLLRLSKCTSVKGELTRQTFSDAWEKAVSFVKKEMKDLGMETRIDGFGNLIGCYNPEKSLAKPIGIGSHIDTVINGGAYDGAIGIAAGLELVRRLKEENISLSYPIEIIAFAEEEGGVFGKGCMGSEYITGHTSLEQLDAFVNKSGKNLRECAAECSIEKEEYGKDYGWGKEYYQAFFEIHAEQGGFLEECGKKIGIVNGVVGIFRSEVTFYGEANHAGTTLMSRRKDAAVALAEYILESYRYGMSRNGKLVVTNGKVSLEPNQHNVVPGKATSVCEIRAEEDSEIQAAYSCLRTKGEQIAEIYGQKVFFSEPVYVIPIRFDDNLIKRLREITVKNENVMDIFSWAGHDAKLMSTVAPSVMLFVPSKNGMSHCPEEYSNPEDIALAVEILLQMLKGR